MAKSPYIKIVGPANSFSSKRQIIGVKINEFQVYGKVIEGRNKTNLPDEAVYFNVVDFNQERDKFMIQFIDLNVDVEIAGYYTENKVVNEKGEETIVHVVEARYVRVPE